MLWFWCCLQRKKVEMITPKLLFMTLLIGVTTLTTFGGILILSADTTMGRGIVSTASRDLPTRDALGGSKIAAATNLPKDFEEIEIAGSLMAATNMEFSPDGRLFVLEQAGKILIIKNGKLLPTPLLTLEVDSSAEGGLLGLAFDPQFNINGHFYVYYTKTGDPSTNQISRFTISATNPDIADPNSELTVLDNIPAGRRHNGGQIQFGPDGKLYVATGDTNNPSDVQSLETLSGKILRINADGSVPADNPFVRTPDAREEIWAYGLRNPFTGDIDPVTGRIYINDVGKHRSEEINLGVAGANYGWPECEGKCENPDFKDPIYAYFHGKGCAVTGGAFYQGTQFPEEYQGSYFFADYCDGWIKRLLPDGTAADFATEGPQILIDLEVGPDGSLYYLLFSRSSDLRPTEADGAVYKIQFANANRTPIAAVSARPTSGIAPLKVSFDGSGSSDPDGDSVSYTWSFGDESPPTKGVTASHTYTTNGLFDVQLVVDDQKGGTSSATLTIQVGNPPEGKITAPKEGATFNLGDTIEYAGAATDPEDGALPASTFSWVVHLLHHPETDPHHHFHPSLGPIQGVKTGSFQIPEEVHDVDIWYRIYLTVTDSDGLTHVSTRDVFPAPD
jgi:glucose/arabinose dehydrogenase